MKLFSYRQTGGGTGSLVYPSKTRSPSGFVLVNYFPFSFSMRVLRSRKQSVTVDVQPTTTISQKSFYGKGVKKSSKISTPAQPAPAKETTSADVHPPQRDLAKVKHTVTTDGK